MKSFLSWWGVGGRVAESSRNLLRGCVTLSNSLPSELGFPYLRRCWLLRTSLLCDPRQITELLSPAPFWEEGWGQ